jgi:hypothetical protein
MAFRNKHAREKTKTRPCADTLDEIVVPSSVSTSNSGSVSPTASPVFPFFSGLSAVAVSAAAARFDVRRDAISIARAKCGWS